jgi:23S rRNA (guanine2445-N2)-methyltransferase / 23S rRNA (guanine2069-N7)-methyltransferase
MSPYTYIAACARGLEELVSREIEKFAGENVEISGGVISFHGNLECGYRCCLWSRFASRIFLQLAQFPVNDGESLYQQCRRLPWPEIFRVETTFAVNCTLSGVTPIDHNQFAALRVKDSIVDSWRETFGDRPTVSKGRPGIQFHLHIAESLATILIDLSGESLHRRGYRRETGTAPLKESLAAAIVALSGWPVHQPLPLLDPLCGSATLLIEAALMYADAAPGLDRPYFGFFGWRGHDPPLWERLLGEARLRRDKGLARDWPAIIGYDCDPVAVRAARRNVAAAGLASQIGISQAEVATLLPPPERGLVLSNLPYGQRLSETEVVALLYRALGRRLQHHFSGWQVGLFIATPQLTDSFSLPWQHKVKLFNGAIACRLLLTTVSEGGGGDSFTWRVANRSEAGDCGEFADRLRKNLKKILPWADRQGVFCFRIYDRDLPDYNLGIDIYGKWVHVQEYAAPKSIDPQLAGQRFQTAIKSLKEVLGLRSERIFIKRRERQRGARQYEKLGDRRRMYEVREGSCTFLVNFTDYLDTGLFLDHRPVREKIYRMARDKRFLNLFGYTGTATVQAAMGGAAKTTTVDLSTTYLHWAKMNLAVNGLAEQHHHLEKADGLTWLKNCKQSFDLIFIDPPTFSNTRKEQRVFDVQRDHPALIDLAMACLEPDGILIFSCNFRKFVLDQTLAERYRVEEITRQTVPFDFSRNKTIHHCWEMCRLDHSG